MRKLIAELEKLALTFEEYKRLHPKTRKNPNDPMFTRGLNNPAQQPAQPVVQPTAPAAQPAVPQPAAKPSQQPAAPQPAKKPAQPKLEETRQIKKPTSKMTDDELLEKYKPQTTGGEYQRKMSTKELNTHAEKMSADDLAWHLCNSKLPDEGGSSEFYDAVGGKIGRFNAYMMQLYNPNITKKERTSLASYIMDKAGATFVGGRTLNRFIAAMAKKGYIEKSLAKEAENDELQSQVFYGGVSDPEEIRKLAKQKESGMMKWGYQLVNNPHTPGDVLVKIYQEDNGSAYSPSRRSDIIKHPNFPMEMLLKVADDKRIFWDRADTPKDIQDRLFEEYSAPVKPKRGFYGSITPPKFDITEEQFMKLWDKTTKAHKQELADETKSKTKEHDGTKYSTGTEYGLRYWAEHPKCPEKILRQILAWDNRKDDEGATQSSIARAKAAAYKNLVAQKKIKPQEIVEKVKSTLNLHGDESLLQQLGERAFCSDNPPSAIKRTITKVSDEEKKRLQAEMAKTAVHDDFDYEIVEAYEVDKEPHKDFGEVEKKINNVKKGVYHGTSFANAAGILADGVNTQSKSRTGQMFGEGFYLASASSKAVQYASDNFTKDAGEGIVFVLDASLGKTSEMKYGRPADDQLNGGEEVEAYEKKTGRQTSTRWHLTNDSVTAKAGQSLDHDEYVVKDGAQIQIKRIIHVKKKPKAAK